MLVVRLRLIVARCGVVLGKARNLVYNNNSQVSHFQSLYRFDSRRIHISKDPSASTAAKE